MAALPLVVASMASVEVVAVAAAIVAFGLVLLAALFALVGEALRRWRP